MSRNEFKLQLQALITMPADSTDFLANADYIVEELVMAAQAVAKFKGDVDAAPGRMVS